MNRRHFFASILTACAAPSIFLPRLSDHYRFKRIYFIDQPPIYDPEILDGWHLVMEKETPFTLYRKWVRGVDGNVNWANVPVEIRTEVMSKENGNFVAEYSYNPLDANPAFARKKFVQNFGHSGPAHDPGHYQVRQEWYNKVNADVEVIEHGTVPALISPPAVLSGRSLVQGTVDSRTKAKLLGGEKLF